MARAATIAPACSNVTGADHVHLEPGHSPRQAWLEQFDDLPRRPGVGFGVSAFTDLFSQRSPHADSPSCRVNAGGEQNETPPVTGPLDAMIAFQAAETFVHFAKCSPVVALFEGGPEIVGGTPNRRV
jgi:hypothetical protein